MKQDANTQHTKARANCKRGFIVSYIAVAIAVVMIVCMLIGCAGRVKLPESFRAPETTLPTEELYALQKHDYDNLSDEQITLRADIMNVTKRNLPRPVPEILSDDFSLTYNTDTKELKAVYGELVKSSGAVKAASISFNPNAYPSPSKAGANASTYTAEAAAIGKTGEDYYHYYKYMLMTQGQHLSNEASQMSANGTLTQEWLKKHPAIDAQYGAVLGEDNAVEKEITLDPLYRSYHATGLYLPAGELVTVKVEGLGKGENISLITGLQDSLAWRGSVNDAAFNEITGGINSVKAAQGDAFFIKADVLTACGRFYDYNTSGESGAQPFLQSQWKRQNNRLPWLSGTFTFSGDGEYKIGNAFGGILHINPSNCYSHVKITVTGAVETPHYILGVTTPEYFDEYLRDAPGVVGVIDTENGQLVGPTGVMGSKAYIRSNSKDEIDKLAMLWHSFFAVNESFTGGTYNRNNLVKFDQHVPAGAAVALGGYVYACPTGWYSGATNYRSLLTGGHWGVLHEIGHNHASSYGTFWGFGDEKEGEVHNNALTTLAYIMFCDIGTMRDANGNVPAEHGFVAHPYSSLVASIATSKRNYTDYRENDYFEMLSMYSNIMHSFGAEKFYELLYTYKAKSAYLSNPRADFAYRCAVVYGMDFRTYFDSFYKAGLLGNDSLFITQNADGSQNREYLEFISRLPVYEPVASYYAGGIDGVKTGGDLRVAFGDYLTFDLLGKTVTRLDTADKKGFEILAVTDPEHGSITDLGGGKYKYTFDPSYSGTFDSFSYYVKLNNSDATVHRLDVSLRISYNSSRVSVYSNILDPGVSGAALFESIDSITAQMTPETISALVPGVSSYNSGGACEARISDFWWTSPVSGEVAVAVYGNNSISMKVGESFDSLVDTQLVFSSGLSGGSLNSSGNAQKFKYVLNVTEGKRYAFRVYSTTARNTGANAAASVAILKKNGEIIAESSLTDERIAELFADGARYDTLPMDQVTHINFPETAVVPQYVYEPKYMVSKKDNVNLSTTGTDKSEWRVVSAPTDIQDGRYEKTVFTDTDKDSPTYGQKIGEIEVDKWTYLIDGQTGTNLHTRWTGNPTRVTPEAPHVFVIDTEKQQDFNYIAVTTRNNVNSYIQSYEMQISTAYDPATGEGDFKTVASGTRDDYVGTTITKTFNRTSGRYVKIIVKEASGGNFTVLAEIDAGIKSVTQRVITSTSSKLYASKAWTDSKNIPSEPSGYLIAEKKNAKAVIRFSGNSIALYAATGKDYGSVKIKLDGEETAIVELSSNIKEMRKLVFHADNLEDKEHTVEIITLDSSKVMLNVIGIPYTAELLNAPNIYLERSLAISLAVFVVLFAALLALVLCLVFVPKFRNLVFGNKVIKKYDEKALDKSAKKSEKKQAESAREKNEKEKDKDKDKKLTPHEIVEKRLKERDTNAAKTESAKAPVASASTARPATPPTTVAARPATTATTVKPAAAAPTSRQTASAPTVKPVVTPRNNAAARAAEIAKNTPVRPNSAANTKRNTPTKK